MGWDGLVWDERTGLTCGVIIGYVFQEEESDGVPEEPDAREVEG